MKNKKLTYVLLPAVLAIWGIIFYRIFNATSGDDTNIPFSELSTAQAKGNSYTDTFSIAANYRDPFMGKLAIVKDNRPTQTATEPKRVDPKPQPVKAPWPALSYSGMIKNQRSSLQLAMLQVNGQSFSLKAGETIEGVQVTRIYRDSVEVVYQKEKKIIRK